MSFRQGTAPAGVPSQTDCSRTGRCNAGSAHARALATLHTACLPLAWGIALAVLLVLPGASRAASHTAEVAFGGDVRRETAASIARCAARLGLLRTLADELSHETAISMGTESPLRRLAVAAALHPNMTTEQAVRGYPPDVTVAVTLRSQDTTPAQDTAPPTHTDTPPAPPQRTLSRDGVLPGQISASPLHMVLRNEQALTLRQAALARQTALLDEAEDLAHRAALHRQRNGVDSHSPYGARIQALAAALDGLQQYEQALAHLNGLWSNPATLLPLLREATTLAPGEALTWNALGEVLLQMDRPQDALEAQTQALALEMEFARAHAARGLAYLRLNLPALAVEDLSAALRLQPDEPSWLRARGAAWMVREEFVPMCDDFYRACVLGDCEGLGQAREQGRCKAKTPPGQ